MEGQERGEDGTIAEWQRKWTETTKASWTRRFIPNITRWENRMTPKIPSSMCDVVTLRKIFRTTLCKKIGKNIK